MSYKILNIIFISFLVADCGGQSNEEEGGHIVKLTYWSAANQTEINLATEIVDNWNRSHPGIQVKLQPIPEGQSSEEVLLAAIAGKTTPDICSNIWPGAMGEYVRSGGLVRLDQFEDFDSLINARVPVDLLETFRSEDGNFYQVPWKTNPIMMMYNVNLFRDAGIEKPPGTYSEFFEASEKITSDVSGDGQIDRWMGYRDIKPIWWQRFFDYYTFYIGASGGKTLFEDGRIIFNNKASENVFQFFQTVYKKGYFPVTQFQGDQFLAGKLGTQFTGPWSIARIERLKPNGFEYDFAPIPLPDDHEGDQFTYGDHKNISMFSTSKHQEEAWEFVKYLVSKESDLLLLKISNQIPIRKELLKDSLFAGYFRENPRMIQFTKLVPFTRGMDGMPDLKEIFDAISQEYEACCIYGVKTPEKAIHDAAKRAESIIEWNK